MTPLLVVSLLLGGYLATTLALWTAHWFSHLSWSPLRGFHMLGHHALYPDGRHCLTERFVFGSGWHDSVYAFLPWLAIEAIAIWMTLPWEPAVLVTAEAALLVWVFSYVHEQFHIASSRLTGSVHFLRARERHFLHHDRHTNFGVFDHFWDRAFGTFAEGPQVLRNKWGK